jgi:hypothetical protein
MFAITLLDDSAVQKWNTAQTCLNLRGVFLGE